MRKNKKSPYYIIHMKSLKVHTMKLSEQEKEYIKNLCETYTDERISMELTRIRYELGIKAQVSIDQVRKGRYDMGIAKAHGRGVCKIIKKEQENE